MDLEARLFCQQMAQTPDQSTDINLLQCECKCRNCAITRMKQSVISFNPNHMKQTLAKTKQIISCYFNFFFSMPRGLSNAGLAWHIEWRKQSGRLRINKNNRKAQQRAILGWFSNAPAAKKSAIVKAATKAGNQRSLAKVASFSTNISHKAC